MGDIIGGLIGGVGSLIGGNSAAKQALTGYNYLTKGAGSAATTGFVNNGAAANGASAQLLGLQPIQPGTSGAYSNYLGSTGYKSQLQAGSNAITGNAAARGLLNSGGTAKALDTFGQNLGAQSFNNYLGQLNTQAGMGQTSLGQVAQAGTTGGGNAANNQQSGTSSGFNQLGSAIGGLFGI